MYTDPQQFERLIQVEPVDNWHSRWDEVLDAIERLGQRDWLHLDDDGWLSARHVLLVAFIDDEVAGHISFRVQPLRGGDGRVITRNGRPRVEAQLESSGVQWGFSDDDVGPLLRAAARKRARSLGCVRVIGWDDLEAGECEYGSCAGTFCRS